MTLVASYKQQAASSKRQATGSKPATNCRASLCRKIQAASYKQQATSSKLQAASFKQGWFESFIIFQGASGKHLTPRSEQQAASH
jgi:hypothetical protein